MRLSKIIKVVQLFYDDSVVLISCQKSVSRTYQEHSLPPPASLGSLRTFPRLKLQVIVTGGGVLAMAPFLRHVVDQTLYIICTLF